MLIYISEKKEKKKKKKNSLTFFSNFHKKLTMTFYIRHKTNTYWGKHKTDLTLYKVKH